VSSVTADIAKIKVLVDEELARILPAGRRDELATFLCEPHATTLGWDYGASGARVPVWIVAKSTDGEAALVYSDTGFGPSFPWGYVWVSNDSCGMDSHWHSGLEDAAILAGFLSVPFGYVVPGPRE
jgi:hypothetical protein